MRGERACDFLARQARRGEVSNSKQSNPRDDRGRVDWRRQAFCFISFNACFRCFIHCGLARARPSWRGATSVRVEGSAVRFCFLPLYYHPHLQLIAWCHSELRARQQTLELQPHARMEAEHDKRAAQQLSQASVSGELAPHTASTQPSLAGYWRLPREIQEHIILAGCGYDPHDRTIIIYRSAMSTKTMLGFSTASKHFYRMTVSLLYERVHLSRPSQLRAFQQTVALRPALGRLVKALHIGPDRPLSKSWFPLERHDSGLKMRINLDLEDDSQCLREAAPIEDIDLNNSHPDSTSIAIRAALDAASRDLDVDLRKVRLRDSGRSMGTDPWHIRVFEAQAALELYRLAIRRCENEQAVHAGTRDQAQVKYPRLVVEGGPEAAPLAEESKALYITRSQLQMRIARPGSPTDCFTHPLLFQRSGVPWLADGDEEFGREGGTYGWQGETGEDTTDLFCLPNMVRSTAPASDETNRNVVVPIDLCDPLSTAVSSTSTVGGNLALARAILAFTPLVQSLSLTGFFERAVAGARSPPSLLVLRSLTLGPPPTSWGKVLQLEHAALYSLERLRICDTPLTDSEVDSLAGNDGALPCLRTFRYSMPTFMPTDPME